MRIQSMKVNVFFWATLFTVSCLQAQTYIITRPEKNENKDSRQEKQSQSHLHKKKLRKKRIEHTNHIGFGFFYGRERYDKFSFIDNVGGPLYSPGKFQDSKIHPSLLYHYRQNKFLSYGLSYQRTHSSDYALILTTLPATGTNIGFPGSTVTASKIYSHNHNMFAFVRQHLKPSHNLDPFIEFAVGYSKQIGGIIDSRDGHYRKKSTNPLITSLGIGATYKLKAPMSLESTLMYRNQKEVKFEMPTVTTGQANSYKSFDSRFMIIYGW